MNGTRFIIVLITAFIFQIQASGILFGLSHERILQAADRARGNAKGIAWKVKLDSVEKEKKQSRVIDIKSRNFNCLAKFVAPRNVKGRKLLMIDRNMWFIKPGLRKPVSISPRQKLLGNASNGDIAATNYAGDYSITSVFEDTINGEKCLLYDLKGKTKKVTYDRIKYWISINRLVGIKAEFFTVSGKMFKSATFEYNNKIKLNGKPQLFISKMILKNTFMDSNITTMSYSKIRLRKISDSIFNINLLIK